MVVLQILLFQLSFCYLSYSIVTRPQVQAIAVQRACSFDEAKVELILVYVMMYIWTIVIVVISIS